MRRLICSMPLCSVAVALALAAPAAGAQTRTADAPASLPPPGSVPAAESAAPPPGTLLPPASPAAAGARAAEIAEARVEDGGIQDRRSAWEYPLIGLAVGAVAGAGYAVYLHATVDDWLAPPAYIVTVPAGALLGLAVGGLANFVVPR